MKDGNVFFVRFMHVVSCLFVMTFGPGTLNHFIKLYAGGSGDGAGMKALGLFILYLFALVISLTGLVIIHRSSPKSITLPSFFLMAGASCVMCEESKEWCLLLLAMLPLYIVISLVADRKIEKYRNRSNADRKE